MRILARVRIAAASAPWVMPCAPAIGQTGLPDGLGARAVAWWAFDPRPLHRGNRADGSAEVGAAVFQSAARVALAGGLIRDDRDAGVIKSLLGAATLATTPHTLCVLRVDGGGLGDGDRAGEVAEGSATDWRLGLVLHLQGDRNHRRFVRTIESILTGSAAERDGRQRTIGLPGGRRGVSYAETDWPAKRSVSWCSDRTGFVVGLGTGALEGWFTAMEATAPGEEAPWRRHLDEVLVPGVGASVVTAWVDLDALRRWSPDRVGGGTVAALLEASRLCNARGFMIHARLIPPAAVGMGDPDVPVPPANRGRPPEAYSGPPVLAIDATWTARSEDPSSGRVYRLAAGKSFWPAAEAGVPRPGAGTAWVLVARAEVREIVEQCVALARAMVPPEDQARFDAELSAWGARHASEMDRCAAAAEWIIVTPASDEGGALLGPLLVQVSLRSGSDGEAVMRDLRDVLALFEPMIREDRRSRTAAMLLGPSMMFRAVAWGVASGPRGPVLLGGVDLGPGGGLGRSERRIVERAREALARQRAGDSPTAVRP